MSDTENSKIEREFLKQLDVGIITGGLCTGKKAQEEFDNNQKGKPPMIDEPEDDNDTK